MEIVNLTDEIASTTPSGNKIYWMITSEKGAQNFELRYVEIPANGRSSYGHHPHEHEVFIVRGEGKIKGSGLEMNLKPGQAVFVPSDEEHQWINTNRDEPLGFVCVVPKGAEAELKP